MNITISTKFKLLDEKKEFVASTDIKIDIPCTDKELTTQKIYNLLKEEVKKTIPDGYIVEDFTNDEYEKIKEEEN